MTLDEMRKKAKFRRDDSDEWDDWMHTAHLTYDVLLEIAEAAMKEKQDHGVHSESFSCDICEALKKLEEI